MKRLWILSFLVLGISITVFAASLPILKTKTIFLRTLNGKVDLNMENFNYARILLQTEGKTRASAQVVSESSARCQIQSISRTFSGKSELIEVRFLSDKKIGTNGCTLLLTNGAKRGFVNLLSIEEEDKK